jgi:hypothetical protein
VALPAEDGNSLAELGALDGLERAGELLELGWFQVQQVLSVPRKVCILVWRQ